VTLLRIVGGGISRERDVSRQELARDAAMQMVRDGHVETLRTLFARSSPLRVPLAGPSR
jgi:hypothetical protein